MPLVFPSCRSKPPKQLDSGLCDDVTSDLVHRRVSLMILSNHAEDDQGCGGKIQKLLLWMTSFFISLKGAISHTPGICNLYHAND